jgi:type IV secretory pathway VirB10-like protein
MANGTTGGPTRLVLQPKPSTTRYSSLVKYGGYALAGGISFAYLVVLSSGRKEPQWEQPTNFVTSSHPLILHVVEKPPSPPPEPPSQPQAQSPPSIPPRQTTPPPQSTSPPKPDPFAERRKKMLLAALDAPVLVKNWQYDEWKQNGQPLPLHTQLLGTTHPQTLEIPPVWQGTYPPGWQGATPNRIAAAHSSWPLTPPWATNTIGRSQQFWQQSSGATAAQWLGSSPQPPLSPYTIQAGTIVPAVLSHGINSELEGPCSALVTQNVYDSATGHYLLIPQGARLDGYYDTELEGNQARLNTLWKTLYFPNGWSLALSGMPSVDGGGMIGLTDQVNRHFFQRYGTALMLSAITAGVTLATYRNHSFFYDDPREAATYGMGNVLGRAIAEDLYRGMRVRPTITIRAGLPFDLRVTQDIVFPGPYPFTTQMAQTGGE